MSETIGDAFIRLGMRDETDKDIKKAQKDFSKRLDRMAKQATQAIQVGAVITAPLIAASVRFAAVGDDIAKAGQRMGISAVEAQELAFAANSAGAEMGDLERAAKGMGRMILQQAEATDGELIPAMRHLGLTLEDLEGLNTADRFALITKQLNEFVPEAHRAAVAVEVFGKSGDKIVPMLGKIDGAVQHFREKGFGWSESDFRAAEELTGLLGDMRQGFDKLMMRVGVALMPAFRTAETAFNRLANVIGWLTDNFPGLLKFIAEFGVALTATGAAVKTFTVLMNANPLGAWILVLTEVSRLLIKLTGEVRDLGDAAVQAANNLGAFVIDIGAALKLAGFEAEMEKIAPKQTPDLATQQTGPTSAIIGGLGQFQFPNAVGMTEEQKQTSELREIKQGVKKVARAIETQSTSQNLNPDRHSPIPGWTQ